MPPPHAPSRLRPPREEVAAYRVRVDLDGAAPPIWRRLELASDLHLDVVHRVLQEAFGWTDSHLHRFTSGKSRRDWKSEHYLTDFDVSEGHTGIPEWEVRLDQVLHTVGDRLFYDYDFGDDWAHTLRLEAIQPVGDDGVRARCTDGRRSGPPDDVGGIYTYNDIVAALADPSAAAGYWLDERLEWLGEDFDPEHIDLDEINDGLRRATAVAARGVPEGLRLPEPLARLLARCDHKGRPLVEELIGRAELDGETAVDAETAAGMVAPWTWLLERVGADGIKLTSAGYLPPAVVAEAFDVLALDREWIGEGNREHHTWPVLELREGAQSLGLLRKRSGRLMATVRGRALAEDPVASWQHIAERLPLGRDDCERDAGLVALLVAAAGGDDFGWDAADAISLILMSLGWRVVGGSMTAAVGSSQAGPTWAVLHRLGAVTKPTPYAARNVTTAAGRMFARAALR